MIRRLGTDRRVGKTVAAILMFGAALAALTVRHLHNLLGPTDPNAGNWGMADFHDVIYHPIVALLDGNNPYNARAFMTE